MLAWLWGPSPPSLRERLTKDEIKDNARMQKYLGEGWPALTALEAIWKLIEYLEEKEQ